MSRRSSSHSVEYSTFAFLNFIIPLLEFNAKSASKKYYENTPFRFGWKRMCFCMEN